MMNKINPFAKQASALVQKREVARHAARAAFLKAKRSKVGRAAKHTRTARDQTLDKNLEDAYKAAEDFLEEEERAGNYAPGDTDEDEDDE